MCHVTFDPKIFYYTYAAHPPALRIRPNQTVETWTIDSANIGPDGREIPRTMRQSGEGLLEANGVTGPFYIDGAEPGDTLVVHFDSIGLNRETAIGAVHGHLAALGDDMMFVGPTGLKRPIKGRPYDWKLDQERQVGLLELPDSKIGRVEIPLHPFLGCVGVAPRWGEAINTVDARNHGGNMDCPDICSGAALHLPVNVPGALLMFGDAHAAQGDGEIAGGSIETSAQVAFHCEVLKDQAVRWPRIVHREWLMTLASARPLMTALRISWVEMVGWLQTGFGYEMRDAIQVLSQVGRSRICNVVSPCYTVVAKFPRAYLPP